MISRHGVAFAALIAVSTAAAAGCSNETIPGPGPKPPDFTVTVTFPSGSNLTPVYSWDAGNAASLRVISTAAFAEVAWLIITENSAGDPVNNIASPVTHGTTPTGATVSAANELVLTPSASYQVTVAKANGDAGFVEFTCCN